MGEAGYCTLQAARFKKGEVQGELRVLGGQVAWDSLDWAGLKGFSCGRMGVEWAQAVHGVYTEGDTGTCAPEANSPGGGESPRMHD